MLNLTIEFQFTLFNNQNVNKHQPTQAYEVLGMLSNDKPPKRQLSVDDHNLITGINEEVSIERCQWGC